MYSKIIIFILFLLLILVNPVSAKLNKYLYPHEVSHLDWYLMNWFPVWRGSKIPADPFILDRMEYSRDNRKIEVYLSGTLDQATKQNLEKSIGGITEAFRKKISEFEPITDLIVYYQLKMSETDDVKHIKYENGKFE